MPLPALNFKDKKQGALPELSFNDTHNNALPPLSFDNQPTVDMPGPSITERVSPVIDIAKNQKAMDALIEKSPVVSMADVLTGGEQGRRPVPSEGEIRAPKFYETSPLQFFAQKMEQQDGSEPLRKDAELRQGQSLAESLGAQIQRKIALAGQGLYGNVPGLRHIIPKESQKVEPVTKAEESLRDATRLAKDFVVWETLGGLAPRAGSFIGRRFQDAVTGAGAGALASGSEDPRDIMERAGQYAAVAPAIGGVTELAGQAIKGTADLAFGKKEKLADEIIEALRRLYVNTGEFTPEIAQAQAATAKRGINP